MRFFHVKKGHVDFVWFQFRFRCTDPPDFSARLFRKKSTLHFDPFHLFLFLTENCRNCGQQHTIFSCKKLGMLTLCGSNSGSIAPIRPCTLITLISFYFIRNTVQNVVDNIRFFHVKTRQVDFVWFLFRFRCTDPSDFGASLFRKKSALHFDHSHLILVQTENCRNFGWKKAIFSCKKFSMLTSCGSSFGSAAPILPISVPSCSKKNRPCTLITLTYFYFRLKSVVTMVDNMRLFHVKN
jgi:hypothetical protein